MKYYIISGEASGDLHASNLIKGLKKNDPGSRIPGMGRRFDAGGRMYNCAAL